MQGDQTHPKKFLARFASFKIFSFMYENHIYLKFKIKIIENIPFTSWMKL